MLSIVLRCQGLGTLVLTSYGIINKRIVDSDICSPHTQGFYKKYIRAFHFPKCAGDDRARNKDPAGEITDYDGAFPSIHLGQKLPDGGMLRIGEHTNCCMSRSLHCLIAAGALILSSSDQHADRHSGSAAHERIRFCQSFAALPYDQAIHSVFFPVDGEKGTHRNRIAR